MKNDIDLTDEDKLYFYGDHCWEPYFKSMFDDSVGFGSGDTRVLEELDKGMMLLLN